jgi:hypothetical protein
LRFAQPAIVLAFAVAASVLATGSASANGSQDPIKRVVVDGACGSGTSEHLHGPLQSSPKSLKLCEGASVKILDLVQRF